MTEIQILNSRAVDSLAWVTNCSGGKKNIERLQKKKLFAKDQQIEKLIHKRKKLNKVKRIYFLLSPWLVDWAPVPLMPHRALAVEVNT